MNLKQGIGLWNCWVWLSRSEVHRVGNQERKITSRLKPQAQRPKLLFTGTQEEKIKSKQQSKQAKQSRLNSWMQAEAAVHRQKYLFHVHVRSLSLSLSLSIHIYIYLPPPSSLLPKPSFKRPSNCLTHAHNGESPFQLDTSGPPKIISRT